MAESFIGDWVVPERGLDARGEPHPDAPVLAQLDGSLPVSIVERRADWARIGCSNDAEAWVDARQLTRVDGAGEAEAPSTGQPIASEPAAVVASGSAVSTAQSVGGIGLLALVGGVAVAVGGFLDWWKVASIGVTAWDIPMKYLISGDAGDGVKAGPFLLVVVLLALPLVIRRPLPGWAVMAVGTVPILVAGAALIRGVKADASLDPRVGLMLTLVGGALIVMLGAGVGAATMQRARPTT